MQIDIFKNIGENVSLAGDPRAAGWNDLRSGTRIVLAVDGQPVRLLAPRSRLPIGRYNSRKAGRMLHHQSRGHGCVGGEKLALMKCEIDPAIADFRSQHMRFDLPIDGTTQAYFPDVVALRHDGTIVVIEVKKDGRWQSDLVYRAKLEAVRDVCAELGWRFEVWTQSAMAPSPRVRDNIVQIQMQRFVQIDEIQTIAVRRAFGRNDGQLTVGQLRHTLGGLLGAGDLVRGLMCRGVLKLPLEEQIRDVTVTTLFTAHVLPLLEHAT